MSGPSSRVRLEVEFLGGDRAAPAPVAPAAATDERRTVLVVAAEADLRRYVIECLRERLDLRVVEAASAAAAVALAASQSPLLLVVDQSEREVIGSLSNVLAIVIVDDVPQGGSAVHARVRLLAQPFTAERVLAEIELLLR
jgi:DNA-binding NarL/FixJ family response regulator